MPAQGRAKTIAEPANAARVSLVEPQGGRPLLRLFGLASITVSVPGRVVRSHAAVCHLSSGVGTFRTAGQRRSSRSKRRL